MSAKVVRNKDITILSDFNIQTGQAIQANNPNIAVKNHIDSVLIQEDCNTSVKIFGRLNTMTLKDQSQRCDI